MHLLLPGALGASWHWSELELPCPALDAVPLGADTLVLCAEGAWRVGQELQPVEVPSGAERLSLGADGSVWVWSGLPAWVAPLGGEPIPVPLFELTSVDVDPDGAVWVASVGGAAVLREDWEVLPLSAVLFVQADDRGGAWLWDEDLLHHVGSELRSWPVGLGAWSVNEGALRVDPEGRPTWSQDGLWRLEGETPVRIGEGARALAWLDGELWSWRGHLVGPRGQEQRLPELSSQVFLVEGGGELLARIDDRVFRRREGGAPQLLESEVDASPLGEARACRAGDFDGDGLDDLACEQPGGRVEIWRQEGRTLRLWRELPEPGMGLRPCDLDGDGRDELFTTHFTPGVQSYPLRAWRFPRRGTQAIELPEGELLQASGQLRCADVDGDGDLDLWRGAGGSPQVQGWELYVNEGLGRMRLQRSADQGYIQDALFRDFDQDGLRDALYLHAWSGHQLVLGGVDSSLGSGLELAWGVPMQAWSGDLDGDGRVDLIVQGAEEVRSYRGLGQGRFQDDSDQRAPGLDGPMAQEGVIEDLDRDGVPELLLSRAQGWELFVFEEGRFHQRRSFGQGVATALDWGGDGDLDLLVGGRIHENHGGAVPPESSTLQLRHGLFWLRPQDLALAAGVALVLGFALRRRGALALVAAGLGALASLLLADLGTLHAAAPCALALLQPLLSGRGGRVVAGYRLGALLGSGGMGRVFEATSPRGEQVALKLVHAELMASPEGRARYRREAELGSQVQHPRVVRIVGHGEWTPADSGETTAYLVMEFVEGGSVRDLLRQRGALSVEQACSVMQGLLEGLAAVHAQGHGPGAQVQDPVLAAHPTVGAGPCPGADGDQPLDLSPGQQLEWAGARGWNRRRGQGRGRQALRLRRAGEQQQHGASLLPGLATLGTWRRSWSRCCPPVTSWSTTCPRGLCAWVEQQATSCGSSIRSVLLPRGGGLGWLRGPGHGPAQHQRHRGGRQAGGSRRPRARLGAPELRCL